MSEQSLVGKKFTPRDPKHFARGRVFEVTEELEFDFRGAGKKEPAVRFVRVDSGGKTIQRRAEFLKNFAPVPEGTEAAKVAVAGE
jgi:hypothetical protein